ncbi:protein suppressor of hairy wing isoform X1 [Aedes albopictus]|uniref:Uncharacterized protein n=1 Tax=Aedes albopictus TaxID=7160 RepID=A0ABM1Z376_AEDAL|nr:protein suppressor of hairy wing-like isoform X1 [Aedes albopictus]
MVIACAVVTCRNHNKNCDLSFFTFPQLGNIGSREQEKLIAMRLAMWRKASGYKKQMNRSVRICGRHFVGGRPAKLNEPGSIDWVPSLHLPEQPPSKMHGADAEVLAAEKEQAEEILRQNTICSIRFCASNKAPSWKTKIYAFPKLDTTNYVLRVLSEKRLLLWCQMLDRSTQWDKVDLCKLQLCSLHFTSGAMAELTDVENVDWIPTVNMNKQIRFTDHVAYFNLYNLISLVKDSSATGKCVTIDTYSKPQQNAGSVANTINLTGSTPTNASASIAPKMSVGLKCILCLASTALKPINKDQGKAIEQLFKDELQVDSELICATCSKAVFDFSIFYNRVLESQKKATLGKVKSIIKIDPVKSLKRVAPAASIPQASPAPEEKKAKLFNVLVSNEFQCKICYATLATKPGLNDHLYLAHKVKINCKLCKDSFSPDGYTVHKTGCLAQYKAQRQAQRTAAAAAITVKPKPAAKPKAPTITAPESNEKHSCYICKEFFTPSEMIAHVKTHGIDTVPKQDAMKDYEACKQCNKAVQKQNMSRHMEAHESHRNQMRKLIKEQEEKQRFQCSICLLEFRTMALMEKHKDKHKLVTVEDKIECPDCNKVMTAKYFKYHVMMVHDNKEQIPCDKCGKLFSRFGLKAHRATTCGDDEVSSCEHCGRTMKAHLLKSHINKVHSTVMAKCRFCPKEYTSKDYAMSHERWSHRKEWEEKRREGVKRLDLDRGQLEEVLGIRTNTNDDEDTATCPVCFNVHGTKSYIESHVRKSHSSEYLSMVMSGIIVSSGENAAEDFDAAQYISEVLGSSNTETDAM